jgi:hypothetical protein
MTDDEQLVEPESEESKIASLVEDPDADGIFVPEEDDHPVASKRRRVVTQPYDLSLQTLVEQVDDKSLVLATDFQRNYVWDNAKASKLVESLLLNIPIPVCYFAEDEDGTYEVVDGHQRLHSIWRFIKGDFALGKLIALPEYSKLRFHKLPSATQRDLLRRTLRCVVITRESDPELKFEIFERLNTNAVPLNAQELRNCVFRGDLNDLLKELVRVPAFRTALGRADPDYRMRDHELVLRFLALRDRFADYAPALTSFLNRYQNDGRKLAPQHRQALADSFGDAATAVATVFEEAAFRQIDATGKRLESGVNRALYDAEMLCLARIPIAQLEPKMSEVRARTAELCSDDTFFDAITRATADRTRLVTRVSMMADMLGRIGLDPGADLRLAK